jgi:hypothetical protein
MAAGRNLTSTATPLAGICQSYMMVLSHAAQQCRRRARDEQALVIQPGPVLLGCLGLGEKAAAAGPTDDNDTPSVLQSPNVGHAKRVPGMLAYARRVSIPCQLRSMG